MTAIPAYLAQPPANPARTYGTLLRDGNRWIIKDGDPLVISAAKRLFPGSDGRVRGTVSFSASKRLTGELNWLMLRYPLVIEDPDAWESARQEATDHVVYAQEATSVAVDIPKTRFAGELKEFQKTGLAWLLHYRRTLLADDMGLGKTIQALAFLAASGAFPAIIVVQSHLMMQWKREAEKWLPGVGVQLLMGTKPRRITQPLCIIHYGLLRHWREMLNSGFATVIFDEIQELRHKKTLKYSAASIIAEGAENAIGLSGTPIYNAGGEIWNVLNILEMHCLGAWDHFTREWCAGYGNGEVLDPALLGRRLREEGLMLRRTKDEVLTELPPKRRVVEPIEGSEHEFGKIIGPALKLAPQYAMTGDVLERGRILREVTMYARMATGLAKAPFVASFVKALLEAGETCLVFAHHHKVMDALTDDLAKHHPVRITGRENQKQKDDAVEAFQAGKTDVCLISLRAASGLNLQRARCVVFAELDWSPAVHSQGEDRCHRIGQTDSVLAYYLVWESWESTDPDVLDKLGFKTSQFVGLMGDKKPDEQDKMLASKSAAEHMQRIVARLAEKAGKV